MANASPSRLGSNTTAGVDKRELFLKVFTGEVMATYANACVMKDKVRTRSISAGKSASFAAIGKTKAAYHTVGTEIVGDQINMSERIITIDDLLLASTFIAKIDEAMNHFDVRGEYSRQMGIALAQAYDRNLLSLGVKAARNTTDIGLGVADQGNSTSYKLGTTSPTLQQKIDGFYAVAQKMDENNLPSEGRYCFVSPATYWQFVTSDKLLNRDFHGGGSNGVYSDGTVFKVAGLTLVKTNNLSIDHTSAPNLVIAPEYSSKYTVNAADTTALILHETALATVKLMDLSTEMQWDIRRQGTLMVAKMALGNGVVRPDGIFEVRAAV